MDADLLARSRSWTLALAFDSAGLMQISWEDWCYKSRGSGINLSPLSARSP